MGLPKRLTEMQRQFAFNRIYHPEWSGSLCAQNAGYGQGREFPSQQGLRTRASELQNPKRFPLVAQYMDELREQKIEGNKHVLAKHLEDLNYLIKNAKEHLNKDLERGKYKRVIMAGKKIKEIFDQIYGHNLSVYLAEETRPYKTTHYKIGKTNSGVESRSTGRTDNPFGLNYICYFEYIPEKGFNLERTFHSFFKKFSTYNPTYNTTASEWFSFKDRKIITKYFKKMGLHFLEKNNCMGRYVEYKDGGYYKK